MPAQSKANYHSIADVLRREWLARWRSGAKLPTNQQLRNRFGTTPVTIQRAMDLLAEQGFITTQPTIGSFLAERPPHEHQVGLVFPGHQQKIIDYKWSLNYLANLEVAEQINAANTGWTIRLYMDVSCDSINRKGLAKLQADIAAGALAGLIFNYSPHDLRDHRLLTEPALPIVHYNPDFATPGMGIRVDAQSPVTAGLSWARQRGLSEVAILITPQNSPADLLQEFAEAGLPFRAEWALPVSPYQPEWVPGMIATLFQADGRRLPQALIITDDHLVEPAVAALVALPAPNLASLAVFAHWNFPLPYHGQLPITRFGYDAHAWLHAALQLIARHPEPSRNKGEVRHVAARLVEAGTAGAAPEPSFTLTELRTKTKEPPCTAV